MSTSGFFKQSNGGQKVAALILLFSPTIYFIASRTYTVTKVKGSSMAPALNEVPGTTTHLLINRWPQFKYIAAGNKGGLHVDDVVYMRSPLDPNRLLIKRVKGIQGDIIKPRERDNYPKNRVKVPVNHIWVEGDNSFHSIDSNQFGPVSIGLVEARVIKKIDFSRFPFFHDLAPTGGREARIYLPSSTNTV